MRKESKTLEEGTLERNNFSSDSEVEKWKNNLSKRVANSTNRLEDLDRILGIENIPMTSTSSNSIDELRRDLTPIESCSTCRNVIFIRTNIFLMIR